MTQMEALESTATPLSAELQAVVNFCDAKIQEIQESEKKSNYHNARRSAFKQVREMILPTPPKKTKAEIKAEEKAAKEQAAKEAAEAEQGRDCAGGGGTRAGHGDDLVLL